MSKVQNPFIGRAKGQAGGMVFSTNYGSNIIRTKPLTYTEPTGVEHRKKKVKFKAGAELAAKVKGIAKTLYPTNAGNVGAYAQLVRDLIPAFDVVNDIAVFQPAGVYIGKGITIAGQQSSIYNSSNHTLTIPSSKLQEIQRKCFHPNINSFYINILIFSDDLTIFYPYNYSLLTVNSSHTFTIPPIFSGKKFYFSGIYLDPSIEVAQIRTPLAINQLPLDY
jgi:hypothetical protein